MMSRPSNSGTATWVATSSGDSPSSLSAQAGAAGGEAEALQDRHVERGELGHVPRLVLAARRGTGGLGAPRRQHGDDHGVRGGAACAAARARPGAARRSRPAAGGPRRPPARRRAPRRRRCCPRAAGPGSRGRRRPARRCRRRRRARPFEDPPRRQLDGRVEALPGEQQRVGEEGVQLAEVGRAALRQVGVRLRGDARGHRRLLHHLGVGGLLAAQRHHRQAGRAHRRQPVGPRAGAAEDPHHDDVGPVQEGGELSGGGAGRVGEPVARARRARARAGRCPTWTAAGRLMGCLPPDPRRAGGCAACGAVSWLPDRRAPRPSGRAPVAVGGVCSPVTVAGPLRIRTGFLAAARRMELSVPATLRSATTARQAL